MTTISSGRLTSCRVTADGETIELGLVDGTEAKLSLRIPFEQAEAVVMTLPHLLTTALRRRTGRPEARYAFPLGGWRVEGCEDHAGLIVTLTTEDGFEVSFGVPPGACRALGWALATEGSETDEDAPMPGRTGLN